MPAPASHLSTASASQIRDVTEKAWTVPGVSILSVGEPDWAVPAHIREAGMAAYQRDATHYTPSGGIADLRKEVARERSERLGVDIDSSRVWVTAGGAQGIALALMATVTRGSQVLVPDPGYPPFATTTTLLGGIVVPYPLTAAGGFLPDPAALEALITNETRVLILNSPSNPLGAVIDPELMRRLLDLARRYDLWVFSDECYSAFPGAGTFASALQHDDDGRVLCLESFSKTYAMTGVRVGTLVVPSSLNRYMPMLQESLISCVNLPAQYAALAALRGPQDAVGAAANAIEERRRLVCDTLDQAGISYATDGGGIYVWVDVRDWCGGDVYGWSMDLIERDKVAVAPGTAFGERGQGWLRISLTASPGTLREGLRRLLAALDRARMSRELSPARSV
ncbi:pyridoxal phosphate-dependent aminotransferase [Rarobacter incanus]|uniref:Aspartate aminotransferase n=1 Tax=Rarobacter incanus TaxID=153494 RepID=A0A542SMX2_9MICO|nr:pyridoxal phosphate-dependent aminotransferase [Rarobacter incanus]TQK75981.1 aspartate aminotransferase [Rarobacter incanus]